MGLLNPGSGYTFTRTSAGTNLNIEKEWQGYVPPAAEADHPFKVYPAGKVDDVWYFTCTPGLINNIDPTIQQEDGSIKLMTASPQPKSPFNFNVGTGDCYIVLNTCNSPGDPWPYADPVYGTIPHYPIVAGIATMSGSTDSTTQAWIILAKAHKDEDDNITVHQYVTGSLWADRIQIGSGETQKAFYYYARV